MLIFGGVKGICILFSDKLYHLVKWVMNFSKRDGYF